VALSPRYRAGLLVALLVIEIGAVASLRSVGWVATGSGLLWFVSLLAATLPLVVAAALLFGSRFRFTLRALLVITALLAVFLVITGIPLRDAIDARRVTRRLVDAGAEISVEAPQQSAFAKLGYPVRPNVESQHRAADLAPWLRPIASEILAYPAHDEVRHIGFSSDGQIAEFAGDHEGFSNMDGLGLLGNITREGQQQLAQTLPELPPITRASSFSTPVTAEFLTALVDAQYLFLQSPYPPPRPTPAQRSGSYRRLLGPEHFAAIAALPNLKVLIIIGHDIADADVALLANSDSLEHIILRGTTASEAAVERLREQLPDCQILLQEDK
jgi:hypothetical protein